MTIGFAPAFWVAIYNFTKALETTVCRGGHSAGPGSAPAWSPRHGKAHPRQEPQDLGALAPPLARKSTQIRRLGGCQGRGVWPSPLSEVGRVTKASGREKIIVLFDLS